MKKIAAAFASVTVSILLSGCFCVHETACTDKLPAEVKPGHFKGKSIRLNGLDFYYVGPSGTSSSISTGGGAVLGSGGQSFTTSGTGVTTTAYYEKQRSSELLRQFTYGFEELGFNMKSDSPEYILDAQIGNASLDWSKAYIDIPVNRSIIAYFVFHADF